VLLAVALGVFGIGFGSVNPPITTAAVGGMPRARSGVAAAVASTSRQVGASFGVAVVGTVAGAGAVGASGAAGSLGGIQAGWWVVAAFTVLAGVLGVISTTARARASTARVADLFAGDEPAAPDTGRDTGQTVGAS
jgi:hypothetical protein